MTTDQKKKYEEAAKTDFLQQQGGNIEYWLTKEDDEDAIYWREVWMRGAEHAHPIAHSEGFDACLKMIEEERNILQNTGSFMWHEPEDQKKTLHIAECLSVTLKYINELQKLRK